MTPNAERVTFTKKKKTVACPVPLAPLADTHAHLLSFWGKDVPETLVRAKAAGVDLLCIGTDNTAEQLAAIRGAVNGMMLQVIQGHLTDHVVKEPDETQREADLETVMQVIKSYLK